MIYRRSERRREIERKKELERGKKSLSAVIVLG